MEEEGSHDVSVYVIYNQGVSAGKQVAEEVLSIMEKGGATKNNKSIT